MDYRETPRITAHDGRLDAVMEESQALPRARRFPFVCTQRQLDLARLGRAGLLAAVVVSALGYVGSRALWSSIEWLHRQAEYQIRFTDIELQEPLPGWLRLRPEDFLRQVREASHEEDVLSVLDLESGRLAWDFLQSPWVEEVVRIVYPPRGVRVCLKFKTPVARMVCARGEEFVVNASGHVLPTLEIDPERLGPLIKIAGEGGLVAAAENRPGKVWQAAGEGPRAAAINQGVAAAARLAAFFRRPQMIQDASNLTSLRILVIWAIPHDRGLFLQNADGASILWGEPPGQEPAGKLTAQEKWEILKEWVKNPSRKALKSGDYWEFVRNEMRPVEFR